MLPQLSTALRFDKRHGKRQFTKLFSGSALDLEAQLDTLTNTGFNEPATESNDVPGRIHEFFLGKFASEEGRGGGEFYTPKCAVQVPVSNLEPYEGRVFATHFKMNPQPPTLSQTYVC